MGRKLTNEEFVEKLSEKNPNVIPLEPYINRRTKMWFGCKNDKTHKWHTKAGVPLEGKGCPHCANKKHIERLLKTRQESVLKFNDMRPELSQYLVNREEGDLYGEWSHHEASFQCPYCHRVFKTKIAYVSRRGLKCPYCSKGKSYPNKFMIELLKQLKLDFIPEYSPSWANGRQYDFYFKYNNKQYILEMDGGFHDGNVMAGLSAEDAKRIDLEKDNMAKEHNINIIRIDCRYPDIDKRYDFVRENVSKSLSILFELSIVDFERCNIVANKQILELFAESWEKYHDVYEVSKDMYYTKDNTLKYLKLTEKYGLLSYCFEEDTRIRTTKWQEYGIVKALGTKVKCVETNEIFDSMSQAKRKYGGNVQRYFANPNAKYAGTLPDGTKLHWEKVEDN